MKKYGKNELLLIWLDSFKELSYNEKAELYDCLKDENSILDALKNKADKADKNSKAKYDKIIGSSDNGYLCSIVNELEKVGVSAITRDSEDYPSELKIVEDAPLVIYAKGNVELLKNKKFAIVGSRKSIALSIDLAKRYALAAAECGFTLVTGIAEGVDSAVLIAAVDNGLPVISVTAGSLDGIYPAINEKLAERVAKNGLLISEYPIGVPAQKFHFPIRNRIIAALSTGVLIVSGGKKSGTVHTGRYALEYGRELFAVPYSVNVPLGITPNTFIKDGLARLTDSPDDLYDFYNVGKPKKEESFTQEESEILNELSGGDVHVEKIADALNKNVWEIMPIISVLEIKGAIIKSGINEYSLAKTIQEK